MLTATAEIDKDDAGWTKGTLDMVKETFEVRGLPLVENSQGGPRYSGLVLKTDRRKVGTVVSVEGTKLTAELVDQTVVDLVRSWGWEVREDE